MDSPLPLVSAKLGSSAKEGRNPFVIVSRPTLFCCVRAMVALAWLAGLAGCGPQSPLWLRSERTGLRQGCEGEWGNGDWWAAIVILRPSRAQVVGAHTGTEGRKAPPIIHGRSANQCYVRTYNCYLLPIARTKWRPGACSTWTDETRRRMARTAPRRQEQGLHLQGNRAPANDLVSVALVLQALMVRNQ
jgi:hypothetical protein